MLVALITAGCGSQAQFSEEKINVLTSFYPLYDFAQRIGGDHVHVINMIPAGVDPHDWSPKSQDLINLTKGQLFIYNGAGFDDWWVEDMLASVSADKRPHVVMASEGVRLIPVTGTSRVTEPDGHVHDHAQEHETSANLVEYEHANPGHEHEHEHEIVHKHEHEHEHEHEHGHGHEHEHEHEHKHEHEHEHEHASETGHDHGDYDPHIWLSLLNAITMAGNIKDGLIKIDPAHRLDYEANYEALQNELQQLHEEFAHMVSQAARREFVTSHQAFAYLARDYGLTQISVMGLSTEAEPTSQAIKEISDFIEAHQVRYLLLEELSSPKLAETLARDLGIQIVTLNPIEGLTKEQEASGEDYLSLMRHNLSSLELALQE
jgi:zinc transport system substrate-binding protein